MSLTTVAVSVFAARATGQTLANGRVRLMLTNSDVDGTVIAPTPIDATLDATGFVLINLWPNARGTQGSQYTAYFYDANGKHALDLVVSIPASSCNLHDCIQPLVTTSGTTALAAPTGSSLIGYTPAGTGAVPRTAQDIGRQIVTPYDFGAVNNNTVDSSAALQLFFNYINSNSAVRAVCHGSFGLKTALTFDAGDGRDLVTRVTEWDCVLWDISSAGLSQLITFKNCRAHSFEGQIVGYGVGSSTYSTRKTLDIFVFDSLMSFTRVNKIVGQYALRWGVNIKDTNTQMRLDFVRGLYCGTSNVSASQLVYTMSNIVNSGSASNINQRSTVTLSSPIPSHVTAGECMWLVINKDGNGVITGYDAFEVASITDTSNIVVWPWIDPGKIGTTGYLAYGGSVKTNGSNTSVLDIGYLDAFSAGIGLWNGALYPPRVGTLAAQSCSIGVVLGGSHGAAMESGSIEMLYAEANCLSVVQQTVAAIAYSVGNVNGDADASKYYVCNNVDTSYKNGTFNAAFVIGNTKGSRNKVVSVPNSYAQSASATVKPTSDGAMPMLVKYRDSATINLISDDPIARITGRTGSLLLATGSGASGQPTGTWTFVPEATWSVNGGTAGASATMGSFAAPAAIVMYADYSTLNWRVFKIA